METVVKNYREDVRETFRGYKVMAEKALKQVDDDDFFRLAGETSNSIAVIIKHIAGNQISRFTDFLTTDGEKAERNRDSEFIIEGNSRQALMKNWEIGWNTLFLTIDGLKTGDFDKSVLIRGEPHTVVEALNRQLTHYAYHIGQLVFLAKFFKSHDWKTLSVPLNKSAEFNKFLEQKSAIGDTPSRPLDGPSEFASQIEKKVTER